MKKILLLLLIFSLLFSFSGCHKKQEKSEETTEPIPQLPSYIPAAPYSAKDLSTLCSDLERVNNGETFAFYEPAVIDQEDLRYLINVNNSLLWFVLPKDTVQLITPLWGNKGIQLEAIKFRFKIIDNPDTSEATAKKDNSEYDFLVYALPSSDYFELESAYSKTGKIHIKKGNLPYEYFHHEITERFFVLYQGRTIVIAPNSSKVTFESLEDVLQYVSFYEYKVGDGLSDEPFLT